MRLLKLKLIVLLYLVAPFIHAQDSIRHQDRPKVGLVLAGGGARGASFIGVLKYLEELDIPVDYVIGTSMGSVIGGIYALGYSPDELAQAITSVDWTKIIGNNIDRSRVSRTLRDRNSTQILKIPINLKGILKEGMIRSFLSELPSAYVNNNEVDNLLNDLCYGYEDNIDFNELPIPFACVVTDIVSGEEVVLSKGNLPKAIRASMAFPGVFSPVVIDGRLLYDGGLTNIFPSDVLHEMGADIIIGIEFSNEKYFLGESIPSVAKLFDYIYNFAIHIKREDNRQLCDILIKPNASEFSALSFTPEAIDTLIQRGYDEAIKNRDVLLKIKHHIDSVTGYPVENKLYKHRTGKIRNKPVLVSSIVMNGPMPKQVKWLKRRSNLQEGTVISTDDIRQSVELFQGTGAFDRISYNLKEIDSINEAYRLTLNLQQSSPDMVGFGIHYDTEESAALLLSLGINEKRLSGPKLNLRGRLSFNPQFTATFTYPISIMTSFNLSYDICYQYTKMTLRDNETYNFRDLHQEVKFCLSTLQTCDFQADAGLFYTYNIINHVSNNDDKEANVFPAENYFKDNKLAGVYFNFNYDNLDHYYFATKGINFTIQGHLYNELRKDPLFFQDLSISFQSYLTPFRSKFTIIPQLYGRIIFGNATYSNLCNVMGGEIAGRYTSSQMPFIGINGMTVFDNKAVIMRCDIRYNIKGNHYLTAIGNVAIGTDKPMRDNSIDCYTGIGFRYAYKSPIGPISLTGQWSNLNHTVSAYFSFGHYF